MRAQYSLDVCLLSPPAARLGRVPQNSLDVSLRADRADALAKPPQSLYIFPGPPSRAGQGSPEENNSPSSLTCAPIVTQQACASTHTNRARHRYLHFVTRPKQRAMINAPKRCARQRNHSNVDIQMAVSSRRRALLGGFAFRRGETQLSRFETHNFAFRRSETRVF